MTEFLGESTRADNGADVRASQPGLAPLVDRLVDWSVVGVSRWGSVV